jgi:hypothetical protein
MITFGLLLVVCFFQGKTVPLFTRNLYQVREYQQHDDKRKVCQFGIENCATGGTLKLLTLPPFLLRQPVAGLEFPGDGVAAESDRRFRQIRESWRDG